MPAFDLTTFQALQAACHNGTPVTVQFNREIEQAELIADEGQKARIANCYADEDDYWTLVFDYSPFKEFNEKLDKCQFYDKNGVPCLSAKEAGWDVPYEKWSFAVGDPIPYKIV